MVDGRVIANKKAPLDGAVTNKREWLGSKEDEI
jgi:hypothetical protein